MEAPLQPRVKNRPHDWLMVAVGRICRVCLLVQAKDEFDDQSDCS